MSRQVDATNTAGGGGVFGRLGDFVVRWPWVVIAVWVALAIALPLSVPTLKEMSERHPVAILPADAPATVAANEMAEAFKQSGSENVVVVVLSNDKGLGPGDETAYRALVDALRQDKRDVAMLQDFITTPPLRQVMTSEDRKAWILPVGLDGALASPRGKEAYTNVADIIEKSTEGAPFTVHVTGPAVTVADLNATGEHDRVRIELAITILLFIILVIIYRNLLTMLLPLITIGISVVVAQAVVAVSRPTRLGHREPDDHLHERDDGRSGNGLRRLPDQPLPRLFAAGCQFRFGGQEGVDVDRQGDRCIGGHRNDHLPGDDLRQVGGVLNVRNGIGGGGRRRIPCRGDTSAGHHGARRPPWLDPHRAGTSPVASGAGRAFASRVNPDAIWSRA